MPDVNQKINIIARFIDKVSAPMRRVNGIMAEHNKRTIENTKALGGFNFSWLSVMFAGMALHRVFGGILRQQMELWGIMEGFSAMLMVVMAPAMEWLSSLLWPILDWFMNLPEPVQKLIGFFVIFAAALGFVVMVAGMFMLALNGILALGAPVIAALVAVVIGLGIAFLGVVDIIIGWGETAWKVIQGIGKVLTGLAILLGAVALAIGSPFIAIVAIIAGIGALIAFIVAAIVKNWEKIKTVFIGVWEEIKDATKNAMNLMLGWIMKVLTPILKIMDAVKFIAKKGTAFVGGVFGSRQSGGIIPETGPYMLHKGETVVPAHKSKHAGGGEIIVNATYNVHVSDREQMERLLRDHNSKLVEEVKRQISV